MAFHNDVGKKGEDIAFNFLKKNGYQVLDRNWGYKKGEIDIIAIHDNHLVIVEVKTRSVYYHAETDDMIGNRKLKKIYETADRYIELKNIDLEVRYDLIIVILHGSTWTVEHITDAFYPFMNG